MLAGTDRGISKTNIVLRGSQDVSEAIELRHQRVRDGRFKVFGVIESIIFEPDRHWNPTMATADAPRVGRRLYWPNGCGPWVARTIPEGDLIAPFRLRLPLPNVPDVLRDDPNRKPYGEHAELHGPNDPINAAPMMKQRMELVASARFGPYLVFQPVAQIQFVVSGQRPKMPRGLPGRTPMMFSPLGGGRLATAGDHRAPLYSLRGMDDRVMSLLIDPNDGEMLFLFGRYSIDVKG